MFLLHQLAVYFFSKTCKNSWAEVIILDHLVVTQSRYWGHFGVVLESSWGHFGVILGSSWDHIGIILGSFWGQFGVSLALHWGHLGITVAYFFVILDSCWGVPIGCSAEVRFWTEPSNRTSSSPVRLALISHGTWCLNTTGIRRVRYNLTRSYFTLLSFSKMLS